MRQIDKAIAKKLFGVKYERVKKTLFLYLLTFWGLHIAGFQIRIAPFVLYIMVSTFTAGVMWQALSSEDNGANLENLFMLPFQNQDFIFAYVSVFGAYTLLTKTGGLLAVVLAVSVWGGREALGCLLCSVNAVLMTACIFSRKKYRSVGFIWAGAVAAVIFLLWDSAVFLPAVSGNLFMAALILRGTDAYAFYQLEGAGRPAVKSGKGRSVWRYLFRYLTAHKNYMVNTAAMWGIACVLPVFLGQMESLSVLPVGLAVLTLNTPICILLSCDPSLEQAVRFLPGQKRAFLIPYCLFIFFCNMTADAIFLCSWQIQVGKVTGAMFLTALVFALQSAVGSVLLEWFCPVRGWKIESDLWHHPRKYLVPGGMLLLAGIVGTLPVIVPVLMLILTVEVAVLLCSRG